MTKPTQQGFQDASQPSPALRAALRGGAVLGLTLALVGCGEFNVRRDLGLVSKGPDEFTVIKQKPLQMPNDVAALPTPKPGARSLVEPDPAADARRALLGDQAAVPAPAAAPGASEQVLVKAAGADAADPNIRATLDEEAKDLAEDERILDAWLGRDKPNEQPLDAAAEARRLAEQAQATKNPNLIVPPEPEKKKP